MLLVMVDHIMAQSSLHVYRSNVPFLQSSNPFSVSIRNLWTTLVWEEMLFALLALQRKEESLASNGLALINPSDNEALE